MSRLVMNYKEIITVWPIERVDVVIVANKCLTVDTYLTTPRLQRSCLILSNYCSFNYSISTPLGNVSFVLLGCAGREVFMFKTGSFHKSPCRWISINTLIFYPMRLDLFY